MKRIINVDEIYALKKNFGQLIPASLLRLLSEQELIGEYFELSEESDASGLGVDMQWMTPNEQLQEAFEFYPGISALKKKYVPIGKCLQGSGDPYFIKEENSLLQVYRIPHESVIDDDLDESQIEFVCTVNKLIHRNVEA